ncbi:hypothetical protein Tco_0271957 [Tanacetum coccineum]
MKEDGGQFDHLTAKLRTIVNKAASLGHTMEDETLVRKLLNVVPDRYLQIVTSIEQYSDLDEITIEEVIGRLKTYEERVKYKKRPKQWNNQVKLMFTRLRIKEVLLEDVEVSLHEEDVGYKETNMDSLWYLDNGASNHMIGVREHFKELDEKALPLCDQNPKEAGMIDCNETLIPMDPGTRLTKITEGTMVNSTEYRSLIGCLRYLLYTRPDLSYSEQKIMESPTSITEETRYMDTTTVATESTLKKKRELQLNIYYGVYPINWSTQKQATVALSSCESEFIAATAAATQALWLKRLLSKLTHSQKEKVTIQVDNKSAIALMKNPVFHGRSKHIDKKYHFIRECVEREDIQVEFVSGEYQKADILTKALPKIKFLTMRQFIGLKDLTLQRL